ncbi:hypothetical protein, partial [Streptomyces sp. uw30]|uniref:hypothetical protein n=1 Tax=Streptomyces sp. uw30 TaxID=1828179 RepID=UPI001C9CB7E2
MDLFFGRARGHDRDAERWGQWSLVRAATWSGEAADSCETLGADHGTVRVDCAHGLGAVLNDAADIGNADDPAVETD